MDNLFSVNTIIIIFIILFPGIIIRRSFYTNKFSKQFYRGQFSERIITTLFWGIVNLIIASIITILIFKFLYGIGCLTCSVQNFIYNATTVDFTTKRYILQDISIWNIIFYIILFVFNLFILPFFLGNLAFKLIRKLKLDLKYSWLSFSNHWHYFFKGEIVHKKEGKIIDKNALEFRTNRNNLTILDILTIEGDKKYLYKGILLDYNLKEGSEDLDSVVLLQPMKKNYDKDRESSGKSHQLNFESIPGNFILIPYNHIINLNVTIKPFEPIKSTISSNNIAIKKTVSEGAEENTPNGCLVFIGYLLFIMLAARFSTDISYIRYTGGMFFIILFVTIISIQLDKVRKKITFRRLINAFVFILLFYSIFLEIFNIDFFNPLNILYNLFSQLEIKTVFSFFEKFL